MTTRFADHLLDGTHALRPAGTDVPVGTLYSCSDHGLVYQSDGTTWSTWATLGGGGFSYPDDDPDKPPTSPNAKDDEFEAPGLTGWTTLGSPTTMDVDTTVPGHLFIQPPSGATDNAVGVYKAAPAAPFTLTAKLADAAINGNFNRAGLFIGEAPPGKMHSTFYGYSSGSLIVAQGEAASPTGAVTAAGAIGFSTTPIIPVYFRIIVASATSVTYQYSLTGRIYRTLVSNDNPGFTIGSIGLWAQYHTTAGGQSAFQFFRVT